MPLASDLSSSQSLIETLQPNVRYVQQSIVFLLLFGTERNAVDVFLFFRDLEIDKLHILLASETDVLHQRLKEDFGFLVSNFKLPSDLDLEYFGLLDASGNV